MRETIELELLVRVGDADNATELGEEILGADRCRQAHVVTQQRCAAGGAQQRVLVVGTMRLAQRVAGVELEGLQQFADALGLSG